MDVRLPGPPRPAPPRPHSLPGHRRLLHEVDVLCIEACQVVAAGGRGLGVAGAVAVQERRVRFAVKVTDLSVQTCGEAHSAHGLVNDMTVQRTDVLAFEVKSLGHRKVFLKAGYYCHTH